jgi:anti-sigma regulatory factor (Ser/Thr protein kinase)
MGLDSALWAFSDVRVHAACLTVERLTLEPAPGAPNGVGLRLARQLCDEVSLDHSGGHTRLRLHMRLRPPPSQIDEPTGPAGTATG